MASDSAGAPVRCARAAASAAVTITAQSIAKSPIPVLPAIVRMKRDQVKREQVLNYRQRTLDQQEAAFAHLRLWVNTLWLIRRLVPALLQRGGGPRLRPSFALDRMQLQRPIERRLGGRS
jgi:hypothetical protein